MTLTDKEVQTVLAALRFWKEENVDGQGFDEFFIWCDPLAFMCLVRGFIDV